MIGYLTELAEAVVLENPMLVLHAHKWLVPCIARRKLALMREIIFVTRFWDGQL